MQIFGLTYMLISEIGFLGTNLEIGYKLPDVIYLNFLNYLRLRLGVIISAVGTFLKKCQKSTYIGFLNNFDQFMEINSINFHNVNYFTE